MSSTSNRQTQNGREKKKSVHYFGALGIDKETSATFNVVHDQGTDVFFFSAPFRLRQITSIDGQKTLRNYIRVCVRV